MPNDDVIEVYIAADAPQAHFLRNMLANEGIAAQVIGGTVSSHLGLPAGMESAPSVLVHRTDEKRARELLAEWEQKQLQPRRDDESPDTWKCSACGELVDADFELCWNCQNPRSPY